jgi:hypothetical protein
MAKGRLVILILAACAESALNRPNAAIRREDFNLIGLVAARLIKENCSR